MRFGFWPGAGNPWAEILTVARHAEATGWDRLWFADHFMPNQEDTSGPVHESWVAITALAVRVPRVRIGHLVSGNTYRHPAVVAKMSAELDIVSGGRFVLGLGAAWQENEHRAYGIPFFTLKERLDRFEEACRVVTDLFRYQKTNFDGEHYQLVDAPLEPKPIQTPLPLMIGGGGEKRTLRIAAEFANEWNVWGTPEILARKNAVLDGHCKDVGRHPAVVAKMSAELDIVSGGRFVLGLGAAWQENEHRAYGIPFFTLKERLDRFEEACRVVTDLFRYQKTNFDGEHYQLVDAPLEPKPIQTPLPLMIGGGGEKRTLRIAAEFANEWNVWGTPEILARKNAVLDGHCKDVGRDPAEIQRSACTLLLQTEDPATLDRARAAGRPVLGGSRDDILQTVRSYIDAGVDELIIPDFTLGGNAHERTGQMDRFMTEIIGEFR